VEFGRVEKDDITDFNVFGSDLMLHLAALALFTYKKPKGQGHVEVNLEMLREKLYGLSKKTSMCKVALSNNLPFSLEFLICSFFKGITP